MYKVDCLYTLFVCLFVSEFVTKKLDSITVYPTYDTFTESAGSCDT